MVDGIHDMGGMHGFGGIVREENEPVFHAEWEKRAFGVALQAADGVGFGDDHLRASIERIPADVYLRSGYYELWIHSIQEVMERRGVLTKAEIETRMAALAEPGRAAGGGGVTLDEVDAAMAAGASTKRPEAKAEPRFAVGDPVLVGNDHPAHHTRSPRYCRGRRGKVIADHGVFVFPDTNSRDLGETRSTATRCGSRPRTSGARRRGPATRSASTCGSPTWSRLRLRSPGVPETCIRPALPFLSRHEADKAPPEGPTARFHATGGPISWIAASF